MAGNQGLGVHVDHVGSLLRPAALREARDRILGVQDANSNLGAHDSAELRAIEDDHIRDVVALQEQAGLGIVTDGEFRRRSWWSDVYLSLTGTGVSYDANTPIEFINAEGDLRPMPSTRIDGKIALRSSVNTGPFGFLKDAATVTPKVCLPAPTMLHLLRDTEVFDAVYADPEEFWADVVAAYRAEIAALAELGCRHVQLDEVMLTFLCDERHRAMVRARGEDPDALIERYAKADNDILNPRPDGMVATIHLCRGNLNAYWGAEGGYEPAADALFNRIDVDGYLLEYDTARAGDFTPLRHVPKGKTVLLGLMSTKETALEPADDLVRRIGRGGPPPRPRPARHLPAMRVFDQRLRHPFHHRGPEEKARPHGRGRR